MSKRIVFVGAAGCGKTTLATAVFTALKQAGRKAEHVHEFIRHDIQMNGPMTSIWEQYRTRQYQKELEDAVPTTVDYVICDSGTISPYFYAVLYSDPGDRRHSIVLQDMYRYLLTDLWSGRYDLVFYLPIIRNVDLHDGTRYQSNEQIEVLDAHMRLMFTKLHRLPNVHAVQAKFDSRLEEVMWKLLGADDLNFQLTSAKYTGS